MYIIPAIDIIDGKCVRLLQGDPDKATVYADDPVGMAREFEEAGARLIHVVDLDGAFAGETVNFELVKKIAGSVSIPIEIGGGIRNEASVKSYLDIGVKRIIIGTALLNGSFDSVLTSYREYLVAGVDAKNGKAATHGWKSVSELNAGDIIKEISNLGINEFIYTDISTDGMLSGPNFSAMEDILKKNPGISLIASGGVSSLEDILKLAEFEHLGLKGCIVGKAIYDGRIDLKNAINILTQSR